jgi:hypothetical protein
MQVVVHLVTPQRDDEAELICERCGRRALGGQDIVVYVTAPRRLAELPPGFVPCEVNAYRSPGGTAA